ncbi:GPI-anchored wall transfer protein [Melia azedarach]|uniref:GPI-anchored wall transfer protein n=1 Tax=Melia azedarach TaxID=155640 RepID=A0ACC1Z045_MELAZ|nr:GPI-anchored wall transfer protein [Melia azedarach]
MASLNPNKPLKEEFVSNLTGSSFTKIFALLSILPISMLLRHSASSFRPIDHNVSETSLKKNDDLIVAPKNLSACIATLTVDFLFIVVPMTLFYTVLAEWAYIGSLFFFLLFFLTMAAKRYASPPDLEQKPHSFRTFLSSFRVATMLMTCFCILAVDFRIFPRENAKVETYGTGLMDLGVGSFVLANAIISRQARNISSTNWKTAIKSASPLILLGVGRIVSTTGVDYQVHVGEYGVHWNFFFTLAAVSIITSIINVPPKYCGILGSAILVGYQTWLSCGLNEYMLSNERGTDFVSQNKEGIFSIFGYWGLYLVGVQLGHSIFFENSSHSALRSNTAACIKVWLLSVLMWLITVLIDNYIERVSRRMCNLAYVTWVVSLNLQLIGGFMLSDYIPGTKLSTLEEAFNRNLLASFILANIFTGLVNLTIDTLSVSSFSALLILLGYTFSLCMIIGIADFYGIRLKYW